jgi:hypothetical protein
MNAGRNQGAEKSGKSCDVGRGVRRRSEDFPEPASLKRHACVFNIVVLLRDILCYSICALLPSGFRPLRYLFRSSRRLAWCAMYPQLVHDMSITGISGAVAHKGDSRGSMSGSKASPMTSNSRFRHRGHG